jgi:hypothetical protein
VPYDDTRGHLCLLPWMPAPRYVFACEGDKLI